MTNQRNRLLSSLLFLIVAVLVLGWSQVTQNEVRLPRQIVYDIFCEPTGSVDECVGIVGSVPLNVLDTSEVCLRQSSVRCDQRYGKYGLALRNKADISSLDATEDLVYRLQKEGSRITSPSLKNVGDIVYLFWIEKPYRIKTESLSRVMYMWRPDGGGISDWSKPSVLFTNRNNTAQSYETAIQPETPGANGAALHVVLDVVAEEGGPEVLYALIRKGRVVTTSKVDIPYMGYPQIEVIGDSLYIAYTGTIGRHTPELADVRPRAKPDGNNVFFSSRHVDGEKWSSPQLVADTEESKAHYVKTTSYKNTLQIGYVEQHPDSLQDNYRQHTIKVGDAPQTLDIMRYKLTGNVQRLNSFQTIPGAPGVMILQWKGQPTEFHLLRFADTKPQVFRTELPEMSGTYYMIGDTPHVSYIAIKRNRPPMELEIRTVRFDP